MSTVRYPGCPICRDLAPPHLALSVTDLVESVLRGCQWCLALQRAVEWHRPVDELASIFVVRDGSLLLYVSPIDDAQGRIIIELYSESGKWTDGQNVGVARNVTAERTLETSAALIKKWLQDCIDRHPACGAGATTKLPTRVIDVGSSPEQMRLVVSEGKKASYAALSHCWGTEKKPLKTLRSTIEEHQKLLKLGPEYKTFSDAADVTRALGIRYVWIDSLCIIQDDENDWIAEAAQMSHVYQNATVTLSADGADDVSGGLLVTSPTRRQAHSVKSIKIEGKGNEPLLFYARLRALPPSSPDSFPHSSLPREPSELSTRGWVVQERILSPRMVHFYHEELLWSCHSQQRCECRLLPGASKASTFRRLLADSKTATDLLLEWPTLVTQYTSKDLTYEKDRLPAISGLATLMKQHTSSRYLAGIWSSDLEYSLLWMSDHDAAKDKPVRRIPIEEYAPSWSWASVVGPVKFTARHLDQFSNRRSGDDEIKPIFRCVRADTTPSTDNIYGPTKHGFVTAEGQLLPIFYDQARKVWRPEATESFNFRRPEYLTREPQSAIAEPQIVPKFIFDVISEFPEGGARVQGGRGYALLRAATYIWQGQWSSPSTEVVAIFLAQVSVDPPAFRRRGVVLQAFDAEKVWNTVPTQSVVLC